MFAVRFWGTRGSIPCPGPSTVIYGGNTTCLEIRADDRLIIVDLGTGIRPLGDSLIANSAGKPIEAEIFISHTHWDHIMGFPMFAPLFNPGTKLKIRGPVSYEGETLESILGTQLSYRYWPVRLEELSARIEYEQIKEAVIDLGRGLKVTTKYLNHPILCLGYRFEYQNKSIVTAFDTEPFRNLFPTDEADPGYDEAVALEGEAAVREENAKILKFIQGADILIYDTSYTYKEYFPSKLGWGHTSYEDALNFAHKGSVKKLLCFHHDPNRTDDQLRDLELTYRRRINDKTNMELIMAREGMMLEA
jgi:phosphoribosyl 1,2-cyclic phosphodiesterase